MQEKKKNENGPQRLFEQLLQWFSLGNESKEQRFEIQFLIF